MGDLDLDFLVVEFAGPELLAKGLARRRRGGGADQRIEHAFLRREMGARLETLALAFLDETDADFDEVAHDLLDVAPDIADFGELGRFDLQERGAGELGETARNLGLAAARRADHQDVLRQHLFAHRPFELEPPPAVAQSDRDRPLGVVLPDDVAIEFGDDLTRRKAAHHSSSSGMAGEAVPASRAG